MEMNEALYKLDKSRTIGRLPRPGKMSLHVIHEEPDDSPGTISPNMTMSQNLQQVIVDIDDRMLWMPMKHRIGRKNRKHSGIFFESPDRLYDTVD